MVSLRFFKGKRTKPSNPSEEKKEGNTMSRLGFEIGNDLRDLCNTPTTQTNNPKPKRKFIFQITQTVFEVSLNPTNTGFVFSNTIRMRHRQCLVFLQRNYQNNETVLKLARFSVCVESRAIYYYIAGKQSGIFTFFNNINY